MYSALTGPAISQRPPSQALVPDVAGTSWVDAAADLATAGLEPNALPELPPRLETRGLGVCPWYISIVTSGNRAGSRLRATSGESVSGSCSPGTMDR